MKKLWCSCKVFFVMLHVVSRHFKRLVCQLVAWLVCVLVIFQSSRLKIQVSLKFKKKLLQVLLLTHSDQNQQQFCTSLSHSLSHSAMVRCQLLRNANTCACLLYITRPDVSRNSNNQQKKTQMTTNISLHINTGPPSKVTKWSNLI